MQDKNQKNQKCFRRDNCRLCNSKDVVLRLELTACPPVDAHVTKDQLAIKQDSFPLDLFMCNSCGHFQLLDVVDPDILFGHYIYTTSSSPGLVDHFKSYADKAFSLIKDNKEKFALDIGSNDGTLLRFLKEKGCRVQGVDPAKNIAEQATASGIPTLNKFFNNAVAKEIVAAQGKPTLITANNVFAHSDDLAGMLDGVHTLLADDGVFMFEVSYMLGMIHNMVFDFIYHEHLSHHSVKPLVSFMERHGMQLFAVESNASKGGSLRCYAQLKTGKRPLDKSVQEHLDREEKDGLYRPEIFAKLKARIDETNKKLHQAIDKFRTEKRTITAYGATATSTVLTYHFKLGDDITAVVDDNPVRQGLYTPGYHAPVISADKLKENPNSANIILAWRFADMIIERNKEYLDKGGVFIVPLPEMRIVTKDSR